VTAQYLAESCAIGDYDNDGEPDVSSGRRWYAGPDFKTAHIFRDGHEVLPSAGASGEIYTGVSDDFSDFAFDMNADGWTDIINISNPDAPEASNPTPTPAPQTHATAYWYENPGAPGVSSATSAWKPHLMHDDVRLEQHGFMDVDGDGRPEFYGACKDCTPVQTKGYYYADWSQPGNKWSYRAVTQHYNFPFGGKGWLHGMGFGDVNGDGKPDLLERGGAWLDVTSATPNVTPCPATGCGWVQMNFYDGVVGDNRGPSHMYSYDIDGDGDNDVIAADWAHGFGLAWYEQTTPLKFERHQFVGSDTAADLAQYGFTFSQLHAMELVDMDGDGIADLVTGKMHFADPLDQNDPDPQGRPVIYVFKIKRTPGNGGPVTFERHEVDTTASTPGVGRQFAVGHLNNDGIMDLCVATKLGLYVFLGQGA
jgi:hypothetical protein